GQAYVTSTSDGVYVAGTFFGASNFGGGAVTTSSFNRGFVAAYDVNGNYRWQQVFTASSNAYVIATTADASGNVYVYGSDTRTPSFGGLPAASGGAAYVMSFSSTGTFRWSRPLGTAQAYQIGRIVVDNAGRVIVAGQMGGATNYGGGSIGFINAA